MFQPTKEWVNKVNLSSFELENFFKFGACVISARKAKQLDATTMFTYSHANTALGQSERAYYLSYFIKSDAQADVTHAINVPTRCALDLETKRFVCFTRYTFVYQRQ